MFQRGPVFYIEHTTTGKQESLHTKDRGEAQRPFAAKNKSQVQPALDLHIVRAYRSAIDSLMRTRTLRTAMEAMALRKPATPFIVGTTR